MLGNTFQKHLDGLIDTIPEQFLRVLLEKKIKEIGEEPKPEVIDFFCKEILAGKYNSSWSDDTDANAPPATKTIKIDQDDIDQMGEIVAALGKEMPKLLDEQSKWAAKEIYKILKKDWLDHVEHLNLFHEAHASYVNEYWGDALNHLDMMICLGEELVLEAFEKARKSRAKRNLHKREVQQKLVVRALNVSQEIVSLLWAGFPDGASARWRTLHEITVVANLIDDSDNELSRRYLAHDVVEAKRALDVYCQSHEKMGYRAPTKRDQKNVENAYMAVLDEFGSDFGAEYGWASKALGIKRPRFTDLENAVDQGFRRPFYKQASISVHAGAGGIMSTLGLLEKDGRIVLGPSVIGFETVGADTAISLSQVLLGLLPKRTNLDSLILMNTLATLSQNCQKQFEKASKKVASEYS
ncbi:DUF5677 domain-containing protein [Hyphobacterium sp.]|uniref:DUF5677 domain-containing protein n=1 Tax=Hyphobacterium sp. TaxID=2004662 RepID=UPI003BA87789